MPTIFKKTIHFSTGVLTISALLFVFGLVDKAQAATYESTFTSSVKDAGYFADYGTISWTATTSANTSIVMEVRGGNDKDTADSSWTSWNTVSQGASLDFVDDKKYVQYRATLGTDDLSETPVLDSVTFTSNVSALYSSVYHSDDSRNQIWGVDWTEDLPSGTDVLFQVRSSPDNSNWSAWCGPEDGSSGCDAESFFTDPSGGETVDDFFQDKSGERYMQYRALLVSDAVNGSEVPVISETDLEYNLPTTATRTYESEYVSEVKEGLFQTATWTAEIPADTSLSVYVRSGNTPAPTSSWTSWYQVESPGAAVPEISGNTYCQYKTVLGTDDLSKTPVLKDITLEVAPLVEFVSSPYDSIQETNLVGGLKWKEDQTLPDGAGVNVYMRSASTSEDLASSTWELLGYSTSDSLDSDCSKSDSWVDCTGDQVVPNYMMDAVGDRYMQYKFSLFNAASTSLNIYSSEMFYVVNAPPEIRNFGYATNTGINGNGTVGITYEIRDEDTDQSLNNTGYVQPSFKYSLDDGNTWHDATSTCFSDGDWDMKEVSTSTWNTYTATWTPVCESNIQDRYATNTKVRLIVDDMEAALNTAATTTDSFTWETIDPVPGSVPVQVDARLATTSVADLTLDATDDSNKFMKIGLASDLSDADWESYNSTSTIDLAAQPDTVYAQFKDAYNNTSTIRSVPTPPTPRNPMIQDTSNLDVTPNEYRLFVAWEALDSPPNPGFKQYKIYRSTSTNPASFQVVKTISDIDLNYWGDGSVETDTDYYYRITVEDDDGNESYYSRDVWAIANGIQDAGEGGGGTEGTPPEISNVEVPSSTVYTTQATVKWDTNELSDSTVGYSAEPGKFINETGVGSMVDNADNMGRHKVTLTELEASTTYYFKVESVDSAGNIASSTDGSDGYTFTTDPGPTIPNVSASLITNHSANISWTTDKPSDSVVTFSENSDLTEPTTIQGSSDLVTQHNVEIDGLDQGTTYYYQVESTDSDGYTAIDNNGGDYYNFTTTADNEPPTISFNSDEDISNITDTSAKVTWTTDELATSTLNYGTSTEFSQSMTIEENNTGHIYYLNDLQVATQYYLQLKSTDINGNTAIKDNNGAGYTFTTVDTRDKTPPTITEPPEASPIGDTFAVIKWETDESSDSKVHWGATSGDHSNTKINNTFDTSHSVTIEELTSKTDYYFKVESGDPSGNSTTSGEYSFTTLEELSEESEVQEEVEQARQDVTDNLSDYCGEGTEWNGSECVSSGGGGTIIIDKSDKSAPQISGVEVASTSAQSAIINWETDEPADSFVEYGQDSDYGLAVGSKQNSETHSVALRSLSPATTYNYRVTSEDDWGNVGVSSDRTLETPSASEALKEKIQEETSGFSFDDIEQMTEENRQKTAQELFDMAVESTKKAMKIINQSEAGVNLSEFESNLMMQEELISDFADQLPAPLLSGSPRVLTTAKSATVIWQTDKESNSLVAYASEEEYPVESDNPYSQVVGKSEEKTVEHRVEIKNLEPETTYHYQLRSKGKVGPMARSNDFTFTTEEEILEINNYTVDKHNDQSATFKWTTNVQADTKIKYTPYRDGELSVEEQREQEDDTVTTMHSMKVDDLEAGVVYEVELISENLEGDVTRRKISSFTTTEDNYPPEITRIQTESALAQGQRTQVQTIISWRTNELATTKLYYTEGIAQEGDEMTEETQLNDNYTKNHVVVLTDFDPGKTYSFRAESMDSSGNVAQSDINTVLAPQQQESVFELILKNFEEMFGWVGQMRR